MGVVNDNKAVGPVGDFIFWTLWSRRATSMTMKTTEVDGAHSMERNSKTNFGEIENPRVIAARYLAAEKHVGDGS